MMLLAECNQVKCITQIIAKHFFCFKQQRYKKMKIQPKLKVCLSQNSKSMQVKLNQQ